MSQLSADDILSTALNRALEGKRGFARALGLQPPATQVSAGNSGLSTAASHKDKELLGRIERTQFVESPDQYFGGVVGSSISSEGFGAERTQGAWRSERSLGGSLSSNKSEEIVFKGRRHAESARDGARGLIFGLLPPVEYEKGRVVAHPWPAVREPDPALQKDHPKFAERNFESTRSLVGSRFRDFDDKHLLPRSIKLRLSRLAEGQRQIVAAYTNYGWVKIATPEVWKAAPVRTPTIPEMIRPSVHVRDDEHEVMETAMVTATDSQLVHHQTFRPSRLAVLRRGGLPADTKRNTNHPYQGDMSSAAYQLQAPKLNHWENCSLWLKNIAVDVTEREIFDKIHVGAVSILHFYDTTDEHNTKAAKLVFMTPESAAAFYDLCLGRQGVWIRGNRLHAFYNRDGYRRHTQPSQSRVLHVNGPKEMMTFQHWDAYFSEYSVINWDGVHVVFEDENRMILAFRFSRIDGQAQTCLQALLADESLEGVVWAYYGRDPCDAESES